MSKNALLIFTRNPELGKVKSRLANTVGKQTALDIYKFLLEHTKKITTPLTCDKLVYFSENIDLDTIWNNNEFLKKLQQGEDLGIRMKNAFKETLLHYEKVVIIGSDLYDLDTADIQDAFVALDDADYVIGPAEDGGYYLLGMKKLHPKIFHNKNWGTSTVLRDTLEDLAKEKNVFLEERNDVDYYKDIKNIPAFFPFLKNIVID